MGTVRPDPPRYTPARRADEPAARAAAIARGAAPLAESAALARERGAASVDVRSVDLEDGDAAAALGAWALDRAGHVDVLVNNAGHSTRVRSLRYVDPQEFASVFRVNVEGVYRLTQSLLESMIARGAGTVITVASRAALNPNLLGGVPYGAAKAAEVTASARARSSRAR